LPQAGAPLCRCVQNVKSRLVAFGATFSPNRIYCNGNSFNPPWGYDRSTNYGDTNDPSRTRGMFTRGGTQVRMPDVTDGLSNTLLFGEILAAQNGDILWSLGLNGSNGRPSGWAQTDSGLVVISTIIPINTVTDYQDPNMCLHE